MNRVFRVGLTGGIASGKTTVATMFAALGVPVIDTDAIARDVVRPGERALGEIVAAFGPGVLDDAGGLDRAKLRAVVFADDDARRCLESITHPRIEAATLAASAQAGGPYQVLVVPLLFESGFERHVDRRLVVDCPEEVQRQRLVARDGETPVQAERMLRAQLGRAERRRRADDVVENGGDLPGLRRQVEKLHGRYLDLALRQQGANHS